MEVDATLSASAFIRTLKALERGRLTYAGAAALYGKAPSHWSRLHKTWGPHIDELQTLFKAVSRRLATASERRAIVEASAARIGVIPNTVNALLKSLGVVTPQAKSVLAVAQERARTAVRRHKVLDAALEVIKGNGTPVDVEAVTGINYRTIYREVHRLIRGTVTMQDLNEMASEERQHLAQALGSARRAELDAKYSRLTAVRPVLTPRTPRQSLSS